MSILGAAMFIQSSLVSWNTHFEPEISPARHPALPFDKTAVGLNGFAVVGDRIARQLG
jgi:hypothetical protein